MFQSSDFYQGLSDVLVLSLPVSLFEKVASLHDESWDFISQAC